MLQYQNNTNTNNNNNNNNTSNNTNSNNSNGPQKASLFSSLIVYQEQLFHSTIYDGKSVIVPQDQATLDTIRKLLSKTIDSVIIVFNSQSSSNSINEKSSGSGSNGNSNKSSIVSQYGFESVYYESLTINIPIYFVKGEEFSKLIKNVGNNVPPEQHDEYKLIVSSGLPTSIINPLAYNFQGILRGDPNQLKQDQYFIPTVVILASYDSFHVIPALSGELANNGNAFVVFELARIFSKLYSGRGTQGSHNIVFALTGASSLNEYGVKRWIEQQPSLISESIEFVLCIDSIGMGGSSNINDSTLYLQMSKSPKLSKSIIESFKNAGLNQGIDSIPTKVEAIHHKINLSDKKNYWKHEVLSKKKIFSFTITQRSSPPLISKDSTVLSSNLDLKILKKNTRIIASALIAHIYNNSKIVDYSELLRGSLDVDLKSFEAWSQVFSSTNLMFPFIQEKREPIGLSNLFSNQQQQQQQQQTHSSTIDDRLNNNRVNIISGIYSIFELYLQEYKVDKFNTDHSLQFYQPTQEVLKFYRVKSFSFDFFHLHFTILYLTLLYFIIKGSFKSFILNLIYNNNNNNSNKNNNNSYNYNHNNKIK